MGRGREQLSGRHRPFQKLLRLGGRMGVVRGKGVIVAMRVAVSMQKGYGRLRYLLCDAIMTQQGEG